MAELIANTKVDVQMDKDTILERLKLHTFYTDLAEESRFLLNFYEGGSNLQNFLEKYDTKENEASYEDRQTRMKRKYINYVKEIVNERFNGLFRGGDGIEREFKGNGYISDYLKTVFRDVELMPNQCKLGYQEFIKKVFKYANILPHIFILVDKPPDTASTEMEEKEKNLYPYPVYYFPEHIINWEDDEFITIRHKEYTIKISGKTEQKVQTYKIWDKKEWVLVDKEGKVYDGGTHGLDICPYIRFRFEDSAVRGEKTGLSIIQDIAYINYWIYELTGQLDSNIIAHVFNKIVADEDTAATIEKKGMGVFNIIPIDKDKGDIRYLEVPVGAIDVLIRLIFSDLPAVINKLGKVRDKTAAKTIDQSGVSKFFDSLSEQWNLEDLAEKMQNLERNIIYIMAKYQGIDKPGKDINVSYPKQFITETLKETFDKLENLITLKISPTLTLAVAKKAAKMAGGKLSDKEHDKIVEELEARNINLTIDDYITLAGYNMADWEALYEMIRRNPTKEEKELKGIMGLIEWMVKNKRIATLDKNEEPGKGEDKGGIDRADYGKIVKEETEEK